MTDLALVNISKAYPPARRGRGLAAPAVRGVSLEVRAGEVVVLLGPSGCGKTTTLRIAAGLETPDAGRVMVGGRDVTGVAPAQRGVALVAQSAALYPHMTVRENLGFPLRSRGVARAEIAARVAEAARTLDLEALLERAPGALSGGERQRVALGRALVLRPACLLLDEPLAHLDAPRRASTQAHIHAVRERTGATVLYVTHDQDEALAMADRLGVMRAGELLQLGTPEELHDRPADRFVAGFLGTPAMNFVPGTLRVGDDAVAFEESPAGGAGAEAAVGGGPLGGGLGPGVPWRVALLGRDDLRAYAGREVVLGVRPGALTLDVDAHGAAPGSTVNGTAGGTAGGAAGGARSTRVALAAVVESVRVAGEGTDVTLRTGAGRVVLVRAPGRARVRPGDVARVMLDVRDAHFFEPGERGGRLGN